MTASMLAQQYPTPMYVFDTDILRERMHAIRALTGEQINLCFAVKANPFLIPAMASLCDRLEVCSPGELEICKSIGISMEQVVFSGVNKTAKDVKNAADCAVGIFTCESEKHFDLICAEAQKRGTVYPILLRLTNGNQFGMDEALVRKLIAKRDNYPMVSIKGIHYFTGTQKKKTADILDELTLLRNFFDALEQDYSFVAEQLEYGPGLPVPYFANEDFSDTLAPLKAILPALKAFAQTTQVTIEMGRFFVASCGSYITRVADLKRNHSTNYCIVDGGIHHLNYFGQTLAMKLPVIAHTAQHKSGATEDWTICGSLCTTADVIVRKAPFDNLQIGDLLTFYNIGAYSITEAPYLFLSRAMPTVLLYSALSGPCLARPLMDTYTLNTIRRTEYGKTN